MADDTLIIESELRLRMEDAEQQVRELTNRLVQLTKRRNAQIAVTGKVDPKLKTEIDSVTKALQQTKQAAAEAKSQMNAFATSSVGELNATGKAAEGLAKVMAGVFSVKAAKEFVTQLATVRGQFQQYEVAMETLLGDKKKADKVMADSIQLAAKTPYYVSDVVGGAKQLLAYGQSADDVVETLRRLGDIAAGVSVPLNRVVGIYGRIMAQGKLTNLTMKQFYSSGIPIVKQLQSQLGKTSDEIMKMISKGQISFSMVKQAFTDMTDEGGKFGNMMEKQSHTITGHINVIKGLIQNMFNDLGKEVEGPIETVLSKVENVVKNYEKYGKTLAAVVTALGAAKAATAVYSAIVSKTALAEAGLTVSLGANTVEQMKNIAATHGATAAQKALNKAILTNPYVLIGTALVAATAGVIAYARANDFALQAQNALNKSISGAATEIASEMSELNKLKAKLETTTKGSKEYNETRSEFISHFKKYYDALDTELDKVNGLASAYSILADKITESANAHAYTSYMEKLEEKKMEALEKQFDNLLEAYEKKYGKGTYEAYSHFYRTLTALMSEDGISAEIQAEIDSMEHAVGSAVGSNLSGVWVGQLLHAFGFGVNEAQDAVDRINNIRQAATDAGNAAHEALDNYGKTELQIAIEKLSDADLSKLIRDLQTVKDEVAGLENGGMRGLRFGNFLFGYRQGDNHTAVPFANDTYSDQGDNAAAYAAAEDAERKRRAREAAEAARQERLRQQQAAAEAAAKGIRARKAQRKAEEAVEKATLNATMQAQKAKLDLMEDGIAKELALAEFEKQQQLQKIEEQKKAYIEQLKALEQAKWKALHPDSKAEWDESTFKLTDEQQQFINNLYGTGINAGDGELQKAAAEAAEKAIKKSLNKQIKEYGTYYQKRDVLASEWVDKIAEEERRLTKITDEEEKKRLQSFIDSMRRRAAIELAQEDLNFVNDNGGGTQMRRDFTARLWQAKIADAPAGLKEAMERKMAEELAAIDLEQFKDTMDWDVIFGNMAQQSSAAIERSMASVQKYLNDNRGKLGIQEIRELEDALSSMSDELASRNPFDAIGRSMQNLRAAKDALPGLVKEYKKAMSEMTAAEEQAIADKQALEDEWANAQAARALAEADVQALDAQKEAGELSDEDYQAQLAAINARTAALMTEGQYTEKLIVIDGKLATAENKLRNATQNLNNANNKVATSTAMLTSGIRNMQQKVRSGAATMTDFLDVLDSDTADVIKDAIDLFSQLGDITMDIVDTMAQTGKDVIGELQGTANATAKAVEGTATATSAAISAAESASVILLVIKAVIIALTAVFRIIAANDEAAKRAAEAANKYAQSLEKLNDAARLDNFENAFGTDAFGQFKAFNDQLNEASARMDDLNSQFGNTKTLRNWGMVALNVLGAFALSPVAMAKSVTDAVQGAGQIQADLIADMRSGWQKFWGSSKNIVSKSMADFYDEAGNLKGEELAAWYDAYGDYLDDKTKELVENMLDEYDRYTEAMEGMSDYLQDMFSDVASNIADKMVEAFAESGDALADLSDLATEFGKKMAKSVATSMLMETVFSQENQDKIKKMLLDNNISGAVNFYNELLDKAGEEAPKITSFLQGLNVDWGTEQEREGAKKGIAEASQDSVDELNGRMTTIQQHTYTINESVLAIKAQNIQLLTTSSAILEEVRGIHKDTQHLSDKTDDLQTDVAGLRSDVGRILQYGIILKR